MLRYNIMRLFLLGILLLVGIKITSSIFITWIYRNIVNGYSRSMSDCHNRLNFISLSLTDKIHIVLDMPARTIYDDTLLPAQKFYALDLN